MSWSPEAAEIMNVFDKACAETAGTIGVCVTTVEGMTDEEEEMAFFAEYLKEGHPPDVAAVKAKEAYAKVKEAFRNLDAMPRRRH